MMSESPESSPTQDESPKSSLTGDVDGTTNWKTAIVYGFTSAMLLVFAAGAYVSYIQRQETERNASLLVATDLANTLKKAAYVSQARDEVAFLQQKIAANSSISPGEKSTLIATTNKVSDQLSSVQSIIDQTIGALNAYRSRQASQESFFGMITAANAQGNGSSLYIDKSLFAAAAFVVLVIVLGYCLWIIGQKGTSQADKKWAKDLLTSQITFLAGVIGGIILK